MPQIEWQERKRLDALADAEGWDVSDYDVEHQVLDVRFRHWIPRFAAYSAIILLHTVFETQLVETAERLCAERESTFLPKDIRGTAIDSVVLYLERLTRHDVCGQPQWQQLQDLRDLRNLLVYRAGTKGESEQHRRTAEHLAASYRGRIEFPPDSEWWYAECWVSMPKLKKNVEALRVWCHHARDQVGNGLTGAATTLDRHEKAGDSRRTRRTPERRKP